MSFVLSVFVGIAVVSAIGYVLFDAKMWSGKGLVFAVAGALPSAFLARESIFEVGGPMRMNGLSALDERLTVYGFERKNFSSNASEYVYEKKLPQFLFKFFFLLITI